MADGRGRGPPRRTIFVAKPAEMLGIRSRTVSCSRAVWVPPVLLAEMSYHPSLAGATGVPEMRPVALSSSSPSGSAGVLSNRACPPELTASLGTIGSPRKYTGASET